MAAVDGILAAAAVAAIEAGRSTVAVSRAAASVDAAAGAAASVDAAAVDGAAVDAAAGAAASSVAAAVVLVIGASKDARVITQCDCHRNRPVVRVELSRANAKPAAR